MKRKRGPSKSKWCIKVGHFIYRHRVTLDQAYKIAERLQDEVLDIKIQRVTAMKEARRKVSGI